MLANIGIDLPNHHSLLYYKNNKKGRPFIDKASNPSL